MINKEIYLLLSKDSDIIIYAIYNNKENNKNKYFARYYKVDNYKTYSLYKPIKYKFKYLFIK